MNLDADRRELRATVAALLTSFAVGGMMLVLATVESKKLLWGAMSAALCLFLAHLSGNLRLFCLWAVAVTLPFKLSKQLGEAIYKGGGETAFRVEMCDPFLLVLIAYLAWELWTTRRVGLRIPKVTFPWLLIMCLWGGEAILFGPYHLTAAHEVTRMLKVIVLFLVLVNELQTVSRLRHFAAALTLGMFVQAGVGLVQYFTGETLGLEMLGEVPAATAAELAKNTVLVQKVFRISAFLGHPNLFGIYLGTLLLLPLGMSLLRVGWLSRVYLLSAVTVGMVALIATLSRSGWLSFAAAFVLFVCLTLLHPRIRRRSQIMLMVGALALVLGAIPFSSKILSRILESQAAAMLGREQYERDAQAVIAAKPWLGWGLNSYSYVLPAHSRFGPEKIFRIYGPWLPPVHHIYLLWWAETGVLGLALHLAMWGGIAWAAVRNLRVRNEFLAVVNIACLGSMLAFAVDGFYSFTLRVNTTLRVFWALAAVIMAVHYWRLQYPAGEPQAAANRPMAGLPGE